MAVLKIKRFRAQDRPALERQIAIWLARQPPNAVVQRSEPEATRAAAAPRTAIVTVWSE